MSGADSIYGPLPEVIPYGRDGGSLSVQVEGLGITVKGYSGVYLGFVAHLSMAECLQLDAALQRCMHMSLRCGRELQ